MREVNVAQLDRRSLTESQTSERTQRHEVVVGSREDLANRLGPVRRTHMLDPRGWEPDERAAILAFRPTRHTIKIGGSRLRPGGGRSGFC
jgi:hypothetical protein